MALTWLPFGLRCKYRLYTETRWKILAKVPLNSHSLTELLKSFFSSGSLVLFWIGVKSNSFLRIFISVSAKTFRLKSKTVSEQKYLRICWLLLFVSDGEFCCKSCRMESDFPSCEEKTLVSFWLICELQLLKISVEFVQRSKEQFSKFLF